MSKYEARFFKEGHGLMPYNNKKQYQKQISDNCYNICEVEPFKYSWEIQESVMKMALLLTGNYKFKIFKQYHMMIIVKDLQQVITS